MAQIRHNLPGQHRLVRRGQWLVPNKVTVADGPLEPAVLDMGALLAHLTTQGWTPEPTPTGVHVGEGDSSEEADITLADLEACNIDALPDALEHDVRVELTRQGLCT